MYTMSFSSASLFPSVSARVFYHRMIRNCFDLENGEFAGYISTVGRFNSHPRLSGTHLTVSSASHRSRSSCRYLFFIFGSPTVSPYPFPSINKSLFFLDFWETIHARILVHVYVKDNIKYIANVIIEDIA